MSLTENKQLHHKDIVNQTKQFPISILANDIEFAGNVGSLFRVADAFGIEQLYLTGSTAVPPKYKIRKAARSADKRIPYSQRASAIEVVNDLKSQNYVIVSLEITAQSTDIRDFKMPTSQSVCLIIGSEQEGISQALLDASDHSLHIPMYGKNSSINVATACGIALYEFTRAL